MSISVTDILDLPFRLIGKTIVWLHRRLTNLLFADVLIKSHRVWASRQQLGAHWRNLDLGFEYSLEITIPINTDKLPPRIAIRQLDKPIASIEFVFAAEASGAIYQHKVSAIDVGTKPIIVSLDSIPQQKIPHIDNTGIHFTWDSYRLKNIDIKFSDGTCASSSETLTTTLMQNWFMQATWDHIDGYRVNTNEITRAQEDITIYFRFRFGFPTVAYGPLRTKKRSLRWSLKYYLSRPIALLGQNRRVTKVLFWCAIWSRLWKFTDTGEFVRRSKLVDPPRQ